MKELTDKEVLTGIVEKGVGNGFKKDKDGFEIRGDKILFYNVAAPYSGYHVGMKDIERYSLPDLIGNPDFMGAVFGSVATCVECGQERGSLAEHDWMSGTLICTRRTGTKDNSPCQGSKWLEAFQHHQQQLIILPRSEQIRYLKRFMGENNDKKI